MLTDQQHPLTPPPELMQHWATEYWGNPGESIGEGEKYIAIQAARWGADQELEACCEWLSTPCPSYGRELRAARRPKPPSLGEEARAKLDEAVMRGDCISTTTAMPILRAALKRLQELESNG